MSYEVHITRKKDWFDEDGPRITEEEWRACVASDPEMTMSGVAGQPPPEGGTPRSPSPLRAQWRRRSSPSPVEFSYFDGILTVKDPDQECFIKMRQTAARLRARVQGDNREYYDDPMPLAAVRRSRSWLRKLFKH